MTYFFYLNNGQEIARIEVPDWVATNKTLVSLTHALILDQCYKGRSFTFVYIYLILEILFYGTVMYYVDKDISFEIFVLLAVYDIMKLLPGYYTTKQTYGNKTHVLRIPNLCCRSVLNGYTGRVLIMP